MFRSELSLNGTGRIHGHPQTRGRGMPRNRARNGVSRRSLRPRSTATASAARGSPVPCRASSFTSSVSSRVGKMSLQFLQERARAKTDRRARVTVPHSFSYSVHSVRARDRKVVTQIGISQSYINIQSAHAFTAQLPPKCLYFISPRP